MNKVMYRVAFGMSVGVYLSKHLVTKETPHTIVYVDPENVSDNKLQREHKDTHKVLWVNSFDEAKSKALEVIGGQIAQYAERLGEATKIQYQIQTLREEDL